MVSTRPHSRTASGKRVNYNGGKFVAADTRLLPFGTKLVIPGYHEQLAGGVEVIDRGGDIKGKRLDVFFASHAEAKAWGRRMVKVDVLAPADMYVSAAEPN